MAGLIPVEDETCVSYAIGQGTMGRVAETQRAFREFNIQNRALHGHFYEEVENQVPRDVMAVPIVFKGATLGVIRVAGRDGMLPFTALDQTILEAIAEQLGASLAVVQRLEREKRTLIGKMAHQMINPISAIYRSCEFLEDHWDDVERRTETRRRIVAGCKIATAVARNFSSLEANPENPGRLPGFEPVSLMDLVADVMDMLESSACNRSLTIVMKDLDIWRSIPEIQADKAALSQVFFNLLHNATKYANKSTAIQVSVESTQPGSDSIICVESEGRHIASRDNADARPEVERIYDYQYRSAGAELNPQGTGVGLYIVRHIVKAHRGNTWASSTPISEGRGHAINRFFVQLPAKTSSLRLECT